MGVVYNAEDIRPHRSIALKVLPEDVAHDPQVLVRFRRKAQAASALNHLALVTIHDIWRGASVSANWERRRAAGCYATKWQQKVSTTLGCSYRASFFSGTRINFWIRLPVSTSPVYRFPCESLAT
jgi:hypothetical protein